VNISHVKMVNLRWCTVHLFQVVFFPALAIRDIWLRSFKFYLKKVGTNYVHG